jgi:hypothetical protein
MAKGKPLDQNSMALHQSTLRLYNPMYLKLFLQVLSTVLLMMYKLKSNFDKQFPLYPMDMSLPDELLGLVQHNFLDKLCSQLNPMQLG